MKRGVQVNRASTQSAEVPAEYTTPRVTSDSGNPRLAYPRHDYRYGLSRRALWPDLNSERVDPDGYPLGRG